MSRDPAEDEPTRGETDRRPSGSAGGPDSLGEQPTLHADAGELEARAAVPVDWRGREVRGRYRVGEKLGEGGMGIVYVAEHVHLKKQVAFKVIHPNLAANEQLLARFTREALATGQLEHAHICAAIDFEQLPDGSAFLVMPFVRGLSLQAELERHGPLPWRAVCRYGAQIADALSAAHAVGIVHRDLKPDNVLVERLADGSRTIKVLDFGVASLNGAPQSIAHVEGRALTQAGMILGTPGYMSPEQATAGEIDGRTDLYALGVMLWEMRTARRLFDGDDVTQIFARQFQGAPAAPDADAVGAPRELAELTARLLLPEREERPRTAAEVRDVLRRLAEAPEPSAVRRTGAQGVRVLQERWSALPARARRVGASALALLLLGLVAFLARNGDDASSGGEGRARPSASKEAPRQERGPTQARTVEQAEDVEDGASLIDGVQALLGGLPPVLREARETLLGDAPRQDRAQAARSVVDHDPADEVPAYLALVAKLELARGCRSKRSVLRELTDLGDATALPVIRRLDETPRKGCAPFRLRDCYGCMRSDIAAALEALDSSD